MAMTPTEFIENAPLFTRIPIPNFNPPSSITRICNSNECNKETTWSKHTNTRTINENVNPNITIHDVEYQCVLCRRNSIAFLYELLEWSQVAGAASYSYKAVRKIGQTPPPEISIPAELQDRLGRTATHYKRAIMCRQFGLGIGAMAYMRRVVDEKTDELIDIMAELMQAQNLPESEVQELLTAKTQVQYKLKLEKASILIPIALKPGGANPLGQIYKHTSIALHGKTDEECVEIFDDLRHDFEYVFRNLHLQAEEARQFSQRMRQRAGESI